MSELRFYLYYEKTPIAYYGTYKNAVAGMHHYASQGFLIKDLIIFDIEEGMTIRLYAK
jgi:hypothetical protein